jgi:major type 1 subunit fimbrin (pilin)
MKRYLSLAVAVSLATGLASMSASAVDGTVTINGRIFATTCVINGGAPNNDIAVTLPNLSVGDFPAIATAAGETSFRMALTNCTPLAPANGGATSVAAHFLGANVNATSGNLNNLGAATGLEVRLLDSQNADAPLDLNLDAATQEAIPAGGAVDLLYKAEYLSNAAAVTGGTVTTTVDYELSYR